MRLQLSVWAEDLPNASTVGSPDPFAVLTVLPSPNSSQSSSSSAKPAVLGRTETLRNTTSPDWTKFFYVDDFTLGKPCTVIVSIYDDRGSSDGGNTNHPMGSTIFELGAVLGMEGSICGKELKGGRGIIVLQVEKASTRSRGMLHFRFRGWQLKNREGLGLFQKSDPFYELQRLRRSVRTGARVWDCVFRSRPVSNNLSPMWDDGYVELEALIGDGDLKRQTFRIAVYDFNGNGNHKFLGDALCTVHGLVEAAQGSSATSSDLNIDRALPLKSSGRPAGYLAVVVTEVTDAGSGSVAHAESSVEVTDAQHRDTVVTDDEQEIVVVASASEELSPEADDVAALEPTFVNYISGGCQLHVIVAVDATASNGDPRKESSLHYFNNIGRNEYEEALLALCSILSKYDTDQKYPVFGFGAKRNGVLSQCFPLGASPLADGVGGILQAYRSAFRSGIVMSSPRDFSEVIETAESDAKAELGKGQAYSILLLFTNGPPADLAQTQGALQRAEDSPLSIVIVGIGSGDFSALQRLSTTHGSAGRRRDNLRFVSYNAFKSSPSQLTAAALDAIPAQLEAYFASRDIWPNPAVAADEIVVQPYQESDDVVVPLRISSTGLPVVTGQVIAPHAVAAAPIVPSHASPPYAVVAPSNPSATPAATAPHSPSGKASTSKLDEAKGLGKKIMNSRIGKQAYGRLKGQARAKIRQFAKQKLGFSPI